jgi:hypothetical protein
MVRVVGCLVFSTELFCPSICRMCCRYPECKTEKLQRFGLCNRHRKWVEKGIIDLELRVITEIPKKSYYRNEVCKVSGCGQKPRRNFFCQKHSSQFKIGSIDADGNRVKPIRIYPVGTECKRCGDTGKIVKGFCKVHYNQFRKGQINEEGRQLVEPRRVSSYSDGEMCVVRSCRRRPRVRGFCASHAEAKRKGFYDADGRRLIDPISKNKGNKCLECDRDAVIKLLCPMHYYRKYQARPKKLINKGKKCSSPDCSRNAACRGLCTLHYSRLKSQIKSLEKTCSEG